MNEYTFDEIYISQTESFEVNVTEEMMKKFMEITGDINPLHTDIDFAKSKGYKDKVVYGMMTSSFLSTLAGVYLPGKFSLIQSVETLFKKPVFPGDKLKVTGEVVEKHEVAKRITLKVSILNGNNDKVCRGTMEIGVMDGINKYFDHTILNPDASSEEVKKICMEAIQNNFASVCVNSYRTKEVSELLKGKDVLTCTVIGFPLGAMPNKVKVFETKAAIKDGADEIDMVINIGAVKDKNWKLVFDDIKKVKKACKGKTLKVIIETCLLTNEEKEKVCKLALEAGGDFLKTSTGFSKAGATLEDIKLFKRVLGDNAKIKASGGIRDFEKAKAMIDAGADRLGTSATLDIISYLQA